MKIWNCSNGDMIQVLEIKISHFSAKNIAMKEKLKIHDSTGNLQNDFLKLFIRVPDFNTNSVFKILET